jgi:membrane protease YdiL (CAAX protease family)
MVNLLKVRLIVFLLLPPVLALLSNIFVTMFLPPLTLVRFIIPSAVLYIVFALMIYIVLRKWRWSFKDLWFKKDNILKNVGVGAIGALATICLGLFIWGFAFASVDFFKLQGFARYLMIGIDTCTSPTYSLFIMVPAMILPMSLVPALVEETYFRGLIIKKLQKLKLSPRNILLIQGFIFGCWHWHWGLVRGFLLTFVMALILAKLYLRQKSIVTPITTHFINNATLYTLGLFLTLL